MVSYIKSYRTFLCETLVKLLLYLVGPLITLFWSALIGFISNKYGIIAQGAAINLIVLYELLLDTFVYGGILSKDTNKLEYLRTSPKGLEILRKSLVTDKLRRFLMTAVLLSLIYGISNGNLSLFQFVSILFAAVTAMELGLLICRRVTVITLAMLIALLTNLLVTGLVIPIMYLPGGFVVLYAGLLAAVEIFSNRHIMKKAKKGYYDEQLEKMF